MAEGLDGTREIGVTPDGTAVYVGASVSNAVVTIHTANPVATLTSMLLPALVPTGSATMTMCVQGEKFVPGAVARVDGNNHPTTFIIFSHALYVPMLLR